MVTGFLVRPPTRKIGPGPYYPIQKERCFREEKNNTVLCESSFENLASPIHLPTIIIILSFTSRLCFSHQEYSFSVANPFTHSSFYHLQQVFGAFLGSVSKSFELRQNLSRLEKIAYDSYFRLLLFYFCKLLHISKLIGEAYRNKLFLAYPIKFHVPIYDMLLCNKTSLSNVNMSVCFCTSQSSINAVILRGRSPLLMSSNIHGLWSRGASTSFSSSLSPGKSEISHVGLSICPNLSCSTVMGQTIRGGFGSCCSKQRGNARLFSSVVPRKKYHEISLACQSMNMRLLVPKQKMLHKVKCNLRPVSWPRGCASVGLIFGLLVCNASSEPAHAESHSENENRKDDYECESNVKLSRGKKVYTDYSVIGIPGDGRCLFSSVARGACLRSGKPAPSEIIQRELADDLRARVADEFIKRREETEWFVEGDFDTYVSHIRKPHVWGGEPELFIASHVLQMPITVYMYDQDAGGLIPIAEYGQEYGKENPIRVLYHGFGHYDSLDIPKRKGLKPRL
ncbi:hypothetical protein VNO78_21284 [Psophocarpus tetragonolobus]|uniref:Ubiquitin thioesterase OTU n=1 Tax=Psophocarpus tetragonolobus TaxID=3891 RepID=A0AAN9SBT7_PSOTE